MLKDVPRHFFNARRRHKRLFAVDVVNFFVVDIRLLVHRLDIIHAEGQDVFVVDRVHDRIGVKLIAESLFRCGKVWIFDMTRISRENRRACETEDVIFFEIPDDRRVHIAELAAVALVEDDDDMLKVLLKLFDEGVYSFTSEDFVQRCRVSRNSASVFIGHLREKGLIEYGDQSPGEYKTYRVKSDLPPLLPGDYAPSIINTIRELQHSETSENDRRLGDLLLSCLPKGLITAADYEQYNVTEKMPSEMSLPLQMGLVTKVTRHVYRINRNVSKETILVTETTKKVLSIVYRNFGHEWFTRKTVMPVLNKCKSAVDKELHRLSQLHIFECQNESPHKYRLLVDPETHPTFFAENTVPVTDTAPVTEQNDADYSDEVYELINTLAASEFSTRDRRLGTVMQQCIEKGTLFRSDYDDWGYTENMWSIDTELAVQLGLISKESPDCYSLNKELCPELRPTQKKTLTAIYEAFGYEEFSSDMFIATLNYSVSYTYASLHKLTLLRLLDQNIDENGNRYRLVVTPEDNPECFEPAA